MIAAAQDDDTGDMMRFNVGLIDLGRLHVDDQRVLGFAVDRVVEVVGAELDHELALDAGAKAVKQARLYPDLGR